jgi:uncharacterized protein with HEPN domain
VKKSPLADAEYLAHIRIATKTLKTYTSHGKATFFKDSLLQDGVIRQLSVLGEAANKISAQTRKKLPGVPWDDLIQNRHFLIHVYHRVSPPILWKNATELVSQTEAALDKHKSTIALLERRAKGNDLER